MARYSPYMAQLPGSSGDWADLPGAVGERPGMGQPGDRYRLGAGQQPLATDLQSAYSQNRSGAMWDTPIWNPQTGRWEGSKTHKAYTGKLPSGIYAINGKPSRTPEGTNAGEPNDPNTYLKPIQVAKDPVAATQADTLQNQFTKTANDTLKGFNDFKKPLQDQAAKAKAASDAATNIAPVTTALRQDQGRYSAALDNASAGYADLNKNFAATTKSAQDANTAALGGYNQAEDVLRQQAIDQVNAGVSRYAGAKNAAAGGALGYGSDIPAITAREVDRAIAPIELAKVNKRYDVLNQNYGMSRDLYGQEQNRIAQFNPQIAAQQYQSAQGMEQGIQSLKSSAASQDWQTVQQMLQVPVLFDEAQRRARLGDVSLAQAIAQFKSSSYYQSLKDTRGVNVTPPVSYNQSTPNPVVNNQSRYRQPGNAPMDVSPQGGNGQQRSYAETQYHNLTGQWPDSDPNFSQQAWDEITQSSNLGVDSRYTPNRPANGSRYDSRYGVIVNPDGRAYSATGDQSAVDQYLFQDWGNN